VLIVHCPRCNGLKHLSGHPAEAKACIGDRKVCDCKIGWQEQGPPLPPELHEERLRAHIAAGGIVATPRHPGLFDTESMPPTSPARVSFFEAASNMYSPKCRPEPWRNKGRGYLR
jgi:hypothetical protein